MKNIITILFIALLAISFSSCSKKETPAPESVKTWIIGKWQMTASYRDTVINPHAINTAAYLDKLNFIDNTTVFSTGANTKFSYSLQDMTVNESGLIFKIKKISETEMTLSNDGKYVNTCELFKKM